MKARLRAIAGPQQGGTWTLGAETSIGRAPENDIVLDDRSISRRQCQVVATPTGYRLRDGGGVNPTRVNGEAVGEAGLRDGDRLEMGRSLFEFVSEASEVTEVVDAGAEMDDAIEGEAVTARPAFDLASTERFAESVAAEARRRVAAPQAYLLAVSASRTLEPLGRESPRLATSVIQSALRVVSPVPARAKARAVPGDSLFAMRLSTAMAAPVLSDGRTIGILYAGKPDGEFGPADLSKLAQLAAECAGPLAALLRASLVEQENRRLKAVLPGFGPMIGQSAGMQEVYRTLTRVAPTEATVLILGESGTGKELVARALHSHSGRAPGPFVAVNCAALPETLLESELFGHEKGAFTGAVAARKGMLDEAAGGTFLLDEIGEMPLALQAKLLRVLQERAYTRLGGSKLLPANVRVIAATNRNLEQAVKERTFREDLLYRLKVITVRLPALRERREDIAALARHFLTRHAARSNPRVRSLSPAALRVLEAYDWPGNIRELENAVERAVVLAEGAELGPEDFADLTVAPAEAEPGGGDWHARLYAAKREIVQQALDETGGRQAEAARMLGLHPNNFRRLLKQLGVPTARETGEF